MNGKHFNRASVCCALLLPCRTVIEAFNAVIEMFCSLQKCMSPYCHIWGVMLVWSKRDINRTVSVVLCSIIMVHSWYKQFLQVGRLDRALILLALALYLPSASVSSVFMVQCIYFNFFITFFILPFSELSVVGLLVDWPLPFSAVTLLVGSADL